MRYPTDRIFNLLARHQFEWVGLAEVGSTIYLGETGQDDLDLAGVWYETADRVMMDEPKSFSLRTQEEGERSRVGDIDIIMHPVRKFARLLAGGNPSILTAAYSPNVVVGDGEYQRIMRRLLGYATSRRAGDAFLGYMTQQVERWQGTRGQKNVVRQELVDAYGFDTKYAYHAIRLGLQGVEYMRTGRLSFPIPCVDELRSLRTGGYTEATALEWAGDVRSSLEAAIERSDLPLVPNWTGLKHTVAELYVENWGYR